MACTTVKRGALCGKTDLPTPIALILLLTNAAAIQEDLPRNEDAKSAEQTTSA